MSVKKKRFICKVFHVRNPTQLLHIPQFRGHSDARLKKIICKVFHVRNPTQLLHNPEFRDHSDVRFQKMNHLQSVSYKKSNPNIT